jgi:HEAT repeat protein
MDDFLREYWHRMRGDSRSVDALIAAAITESDEDVIQNAVAVLHFRGTKDVLKRAEELCQSNGLKERCLGARILGDLGASHGVLEDERLSILLRMLDSENDADVLPSILTAMGCIHRLEAIEPASQYAGHRDPDVRHGTVLAMMGHNDQLAIDVLIGLSRDADAHVRDWATFALGQQIDVDTPAIREALANRLDDSDYDTRCEGIVGLANRGDRRAIPFISRALTSDCVENLIVEAAGLIPDPQFYPQLLALREWWDGPETTLNEAIAACAATVGDAIA